VTPEAEATAVRQPPGSFRLRDLVYRFRRVHLLAAVIIGACGGFAAILFRFLIEGSTWVFTGGRTTDPIGFGILSWWWVLLMPAAGGLFVGLISHFLAPEVKGTGVPEVIEAVALRGAHVRKRVGAFKAVAVAACLGSGGSAGREGPIVHVGAALGSLVGRLLAVPVTQLRTFVGCGAAAGIAATFNAPIAGAMFAGEVILGTFGVVRFSAIVISAVVATVISRAFIGNFPAFVVPAFRMLNTYELFFYAGIGVIAALLGCLFIWIGERTSVWFDRSRLHPVARPVAGGVLVGAIGMLLPGVLGVGYGAINDAMHVGIPVVVMAGLLGGKLIATSVTLGSGGSGGIFAPSLFIGAMLGGLVGAGLAALMPGDVGSGGSYALVAMGAMVAATTRAPITAIIIIFEMTNNYTIILPLMIACIVATLLAGRIIEPSIYHAKLLRRGIDLSLRDHANVLRNVTVGAVRLAHTTFVREQTPLPDILEMVMERQEQHYVVVDDEQHYVGLIHLSELRYTFYNEEALSGLVVAADLVHHDLPVLYPDESLDVALKLLSTSGTDTLVVLDPSNHVDVLGVITRDAVIETYNRELLDRDMPGETAGLVMTAERTRVVDLGERTVLAEVEAPPVFVGKRLRELDLRKRYDAQVMLVRRLANDGRSTHPVREVPGPEFEIQPGDKMLVLTNPSGLEKLTAL
jgi:CIC family chloride channel protein